VYKQTTKVMNRVQKISRITSILRKCIGNSSEEFSTYVLNEIQYLNGNLWVDGVSQPIEYFPLNVKKQTLINYILKLRAKYQKILLYNVDLSEYELAVVTKRIIILEHLASKKKEQLRKSLEKYRLKINELQNTSQINP
jgi:hypothetical protein